MPGLTPSVLRFWCPTAMTFFVNGVGFGGWAAQIPRATARLQVDEGTFGLMLLGMGVGAVVGMMFSGRLIARLGAPALMRLTFVMFLTTYIVLSTTSDMAVFIAALLLYGASGGLMDVAMNAYASDLEVHKNWRVMASFHGVWSIGGLVGAAAGGFLLGIGSDLTQALAITGGLAALFMLCQHDLIRLPHREGEWSKRWAIGQVTLILGILAALCFAAEGAVRDWSSLYLANEVQASIALAGWGFAAFSATMALGRLTGDWMRVRFGEREVVVISGIIAVAGYGVAVMSGGYALAVAGFALVGLGLSNIVPILISAAGRTASPASSIAFVVSLGYAGYLASPPLLGLVASRTSLATMFLVVASTCLALSLGWLLVDTARRKA